MLEAGDDVNGGKRRESFRPLLEAEAGVNDGIRRESFRSLLEAGADSNGASGRGFFCYTACLDGLDGRTEGMAP